VFVTEKASVETRNQGKHGCRTNALLRVSDLRRSKTMLTVADHSSGAFSGIVTVGCRHAIRRSLLRWLAVS
jgi:hypothetical protein